MSSIEKHCEDLTFPLSCKIDWFFVYIVPWWPALFLLVLISIPIWVFIYSERNMDRDIAETDYWKSRHNEPGDDL